MASSSVNVRTAKAEEFADIDEVDEEEVPVSPAIMTPAAKSICMTIAARKDLFRIESGADETFAEWLSFASTARSCPGP